ncbi:FecCD family ABC transporter permease [Thioalkalivibrio paradoxus]|uniref:ABC transporter permease n=1 Tax=Thioalkalivibrio paradoxus ARh 1 TaxID=713585 RepID=W0DQ41_9GAMM|nr:iron ABC transporter permease [Thioalkalivibrio paradoxus]AHE99362.1 ABC transporter permease [Thioalkalivibrio paradoxus ARh 1]
MNTVRQRLFGVVLLASIAACLLAINLVWGSSGWVWPLGPDAAVERVILVELRLPRALAALAAGGLLGLAGALVQVLTRNPLADPFILGISGGAAVGALLAILLGGPLLAQHLGAAVGAFAALALVLGLARGEHAWTGHRLLLTGVVLASALGAVVTLLLAIAPDRALRGMLFWLMGDLSAAPGPWIALVGLAVLALLTLPLARDLNILTRGELAAASLGVSVGSLRYLAYLGAAVATALAVITAGTIGFVGLLAPHLARLIVGTDHRAALPAAVLLGGSLVLLADLIARVVIAPQQLPAGSVLALIGAPMFLYLLHRAQRP